MTSQDWEYEDGSPPPKMIVDNWLQMLKVHVRENPTNSIAVHCVAGLGRLIKNCILFKIM